MTESYSVATTLTVRDDLTAALERIANLAMKVADNLGKIKIDESFSKFTKMAEKASAGFTKAKDSAESFGQAAASSAADAARGMTEVATQAERAAVAMRRASSEVRSMRGQIGGGSSLLALAAPRAPSRQSAIGYDKFIDAPWWRDVTAQASAGGGGRGFSGGGYGSYGPYDAGGGGGRQTNVRSGAMVPYGAYGGGGDGQIPLNFPAGGGGGGGHRRDAFDMMIAGDYMRRGGDDVLGQYHQMWEAGTTYQQSLARFGAIGASMNGQGTDQAATLADADKMARTANIRGVTSTDMIETLGSLHTALGKYGESKELAPLVAKMEFANAAVAGNHNGFGLAQVAALGKVVEMRGGFKGKKDYMEQADMMQHVMSGTAYAVKPSDYLAFLKTSGIAGRLQGNNAFFYQMEPLIQEMSGNRVGTALMSAYQNLGQGRTTQRTMNELGKLGLLAGNSDVDNIQKYGLEAAMKMWSSRQGKIDPNAVEFSKGGKLLAIHPGAVLGGDMVASDPKKFLETILLPAFKAKGITSDKDTINEIGTLFTNRTAAALYSLLYQQRDKITKNEGIDRGAAGISDIEKTAETTPAGAELAAKAAWHNLYIELGTDIIPMVVPALNEMTKGLQNLAGWARENPGLTKAILIFVGALGGLTALGGMLIGFAAAIIILRNAGIIGIASDIGKFAGSVTRLSSIPFEAIAGGLLRFLGPLAAFAQVLNGGALNKGEGTDLDKMMPVGPDGKRHWASPEAQAAALGTTPQVAAAANTTLHTTVNLDGKKVAESVNNHNSRDAARPPSSTGNTDGKINPMYPTSGN